MLNKVINITFPSDVYHSTAHNYKAQNRKYYIISQLSYN